MPKKRLEVLPAARYCVIANQNSKRQLSYSFFPVNLKKDKIP